MPRAGPGRGWRWCLGLLAVAAVLSASATTFVTVDANAGRGLAIAAVVALISVPVLFGVAVERVALRLGARVRAERFAAYAVPLASAGMLLVACTWTALATGRAFAAAPARYGWTDSLVSAMARRLGHALAPHTGPSRPQPAPTTTSPSGSPPPIPPLADARAHSSAPSTTLPAGSGRFASGNASYRETGDACLALSDVADLARAHQPRGTRATADALARRRYPTGLPFLQAQDDAQLAVWFTGAPDSFDGVASRFDTAVHEGAHFWGFKRFNARTVSYPVRADLTIETRRLNNFHRSEVMAQHVDAASDSYALTYLSGQSGAQGFNSLLDEYNAYAHSLAARYCLRDLMPPSSRVSARDGILTMMYYVEVYLRIARTSHPADYAAILGDPDHRRLILTVWDRAEYFLRATEPFPALGIADDRIEKWVYTTDGLEELARVRRAGP